MYAVKSPTRSIIIISENMSQLSHFKSICKCNRGKDAERQINRRRKGKGGRNERKKKKNEKIFESIQLKTIERDSSESCAV